MLKGINPLINADVLHALRAMGHGDDLIIADTNFPADSTARQTRLGTLLRIDATAAQVAEAVLSVYPLDTFVDDAAARMEVVGKPDEIPPVQQDVQKAVDNRFKGKSSWLRVVRVAKGMEDEAGNKPKPPAAEAAANAADAFRNSRRLRSFISPSRCESWG